MHTLSRLGIPVERRQLPLGDFLFLARPEFANEHVFADYARLEKHFMALDGGRYPGRLGETDFELVFDLVVERKSAVDFCASLVDGRLDNQVRRLEASRFGKVVFLVEGAYESNTSRAGGLTRLCQPPDV